MCRLETLSTAPRPAGLAIVILARATATEPTHQPDRSGATTGEPSMPRGDKSSYTDKQKRQADHIRAGYEKSGASHGASEARAWATVNKMTHGGKKSGSGRGKRVDTAPARKGGRKGGMAA